MTSLLSIIPSKGLARMCPAKGGRILGPLGLIGLSVVGVNVAINMIIGTTELSPTHNLLLLASVAAVIYSVQCNPKGSPKSPLAL
ncbi:hypothetical protein [Rhizobium sp. BK176]|uniref:hypothetical protein n=1 Tax=Rhizobium sp. BK176 TaxID=2587071 RepID=UPI0021697F46|nr:hypothetical protein [Rhizobium sp. BK176]MCS4088555.1 hypothetical protein [Rhizobium sp. BK176]